MFTAPAVLQLLASSTGQPIDGDDAWDGLGCLQRLNLITWVPETTSPRVQVHALVQRATRESLPADKITTVAITAADALVQIWPHVERDAALSQVLRANTNALNTAVGEHLWATGRQTVLFYQGLSLGKGGLALEATTYFAE